MISIKKVRDLRNKLQFVSVDNLNLNDFRLHKVLVLLDIESIQKVKYNTLVKTFAVYNKDFKMNNKALKLLNSHDIIVTDLKPEELEKAIINYSKEKQLDFFSIPQLILENNYYTKLK